MDPQTAPQASAPTLQPVAKAIGSKDNPVKVTIPGAQARHDSKARATERVSRSSMAKALTSMRTRGPDGKFVRSEPQSQTNAEQVAGQPVEPQDEAPAPVDTENPTPTETETKADPKLSEVEGKLAQAIEREGRYREGSRLAGEKIADLTDEVEHYKSLFAAARATIRQHLGTDIDESEIERRDLLRQLKRYQRTGKQAEEQQRQTQIGQMAAAIKAQVANAIQKHPEMDPETNPEAKAWWAAWFRGGADVKDLDRDVAGGALLFRSRQVATQQKQAEAQKPPVPAARPRPDSTIPNGSAGLAPARAARPGDKVSTKAIVTEMQKYRAARGRG